MVARTWLAIEVELLHGVHAECEPPPGRVMIVGPSHTFGQLARAINVAFARWDHSHLFEFVLADGSTISFPEFDIDEETIDQATTKVHRLVKPGDRFSYRFDFGDDWMHECVVEAGKVDPVDAYGLMPPEPVPVFGWGTIPDQYGRTTSGRGEEDVDFPEPPFPFLHHELERIIELNGRKPMSSTDLADTVNAEGRYTKQDGSRMTASQVSARANKYPQLFERTDDERIALRRDRRD